MNTQANDTPLWVKLSFQRSSTYQDGRMDRSVTVRVVPVKRSAEALNLPSALTYFSGPDTAWGDFEAMVMIFDRYTPAAEMTVRYYNPYEVRTARAEMMAKHLRRIETALDKMTQSDGATLSIGQWVLRFCKAIKAAGILYEGDDGTLFEVTNGNIPSTVDFRISKQTAWVRGEFDS